MKLPNLIGCGAGKSGTTSLFYYLAEHPEIFMAMAKEIHFFSQHYHKGLEWYGKHFSNSGDAKILGEFSTSYMLDKKVPERIAKVVPDAKLLFIFRDPVERAYSNYWSAMNMGTQSADKSFSEVIREDEGFEEYIVPGFYDQHLNRFLDFFNREQMYIMFTEDLKREPIRVMSSCYQFLGVDPSFKPNIEESYNVTVVPPNRFLLSVDKFWLELKKTIKPYFLWLPQSFRRVFARAEKELRGMINRGERAPMEKQDREYLLELYQEHIDRLIDFLDRELPWDYSA